MKKINNNLISFTTLQIFTLTNVVDETLKREDLSDITRLTLNEISEKLYKKIEIIKGDK